MKMTDQDLELKLTYEQAKSILRAHEVARGETAEACVNPDVLEQICEHWPNLRAEYNISSEPGVFFERSEVVASYSTHPWIVCVEVWEGTQVVREYFAAPEVNGHAQDEPFVTVLGDRTELICLLPRSAPGPLAHKLRQALANSGLMYRALNDRALRAAQHVALGRWWQLVDTGDVWYDRAKKEWVEVAGG